jgi:hypothetical protein
MRPLWCVVVLLFLASEPQITVASHISQEMASAQIRLPKTLSQQLVDSQNKPMQANASDDHQQPNPNPNPNENPNGNQIGLTSSSQARALAAKSRIARESSNHQHLSFCISLLSASSIILIFFLFVRSLL